MTSWWGLIKFFFGKGSTSALYNTSKIFLKICKLNLLEKDHNFGKTPWFYITKKKTNF